MNKKTKLKLNETLNKALEPPKKRSKSALDNLLNQYDSNDALPVGIHPTQPNPTQHNTIQYNQTQPKKTSISPTRDFTKVPNSITKHAIPQKLFKGMSKHTYDILYRHTRGGIKPVRQIQLTKGEIMKLTGLSFNTVQTHIKYLKDIGLVKVEFLIGKHEGSVYEILVPEEIGHPTQPKTTQPNPTRDNAIQETQPDTIQKLGLVGLGNIIENKEDTESLRLSLKTNTNDDELTRKIGGFVRAKLGRELGEKEKDFSGVINILIGEFESAVSNAKTISNVPAFLETHLKHVLAKEKLSTVKDDKQLASAKKDDKIIEDVAPYEPESLKPEARQIVLDSLRTAKERGEDITLFRKSYTETDWQWLRRELEK